MEGITENQHAYIIEGERDISILALKEMLQTKWHVKTKGSPDIREEHFETFNIDDARKLKELAIMKPFEKKNVFILATNFIGHEAQNALLKLLEEPIANTYFFILIPNANSLLGTVRSRVATIKFEGTEKAELSNPKEFLKATQEERLKILSSFLSHDSQTKKSDLITFLNSLERELASGESTAKRQKETNIALEDIIHFKKYLFDRSPSVKMIGEYLALRLPIV